MVESGIRGGLSVVCTKYAKASNPRIKGYEPEKPTSHCIYLDANNLYGWAMSQKMPYSDHKWLKQSEIQQFDVTTISDESDVGYILEVDLHYPKELHDLHNDFSCCSCSKKHIIK